ncbi:MAG: thymidine phosphorylase [Spirochaetales bacterium]
MNIYDIIVKKKNKHSLTKEEIDFFIDGIISGAVKDFEASALLMAIAINGMDIDETYNLTMAMANSGAIVNLKDVKGITVDKHSTGGVSDTTTLIIAPIVACLGLKMAKMSGRGLGFTGGTADKLEVFKGYNLNLNQKEFINIVNSVGASIITQTKNLAPADKILYSLRDLTGSIESIPLIASSIMSKKLASNASVIVLDVKFGDGAFMKNVSTATLLAKTMVEIGKKAGKKISAILTSMDEPLGSGIGSNLEVKNAINVLSGKNNNLAKVSKTLAEKLLVLAGVYDAKSAKKAVNEVINNGSALLKLQEIIRAHGGDDQIITRQELMPKANAMLVVKAAKSGYVNKIKTEQLGFIVNSLGGGRTSANDKIDHTVGLKLFVKINSKVKAGEKICEIYAKSLEDAKNVEARVLDSLIIKSSKASESKLIQTVIG